ncbi:oxidoreductase [Cryobacterium sp. LW097]|uniref:Rossmann-like and DUF2520 domain-containing protein n=1 Tax=unclassified Cryobacterium TaxID=2649013 RepID=UPI000B4D406E|nr:MULTISPECIES: DUF2520 domain-containing protein [unclassified Cryobacterium]ASD23281.1 oxidoreductase [Cryobacterium sp. LW097]TFC52704.1 DUF2520 domain-containing protein [Cryobacterium sp. TMB3-1-2]TFC60256.1 DUF2520 domain-containing protein [Cryobacterium sp. TMB1-7]TFC68349.1 DUF2520 domain-containing protein [Cryobacterium sp. TMB3-15]TFC74950.1 DUF2520 domain-containing protein [Cryobacterium sp. TMB3-10]
MTVRPGRLGIGVIGAGHVGPILAAALAGAGHALIGISAISQASRDRAEAILPGVPVLTVPEVVERSELVIIAVPDDQLDSLVTGLAATGTWQPGQLVLHTSARYGTNVLLPAQRAGAIPLAIHPAMAFTGTSLDISRLADSYFAVTAPAPVLPIAQALVVEMGGEPVIVAEGDREVYSEAIETATAFSSSIVDQSTRLLSEIGIEAPGAVIAPLVRSAIENALTRTGARHPLDDLADLGDTTHLLDPPYPPHPPHPFDPEDQ